jgi:hypothetical protein
MIALLGVVLAKITALVPVVLLFSELLDTSFPSGVGRSDRR